jgi:hypothetical protein
MNRSGEKMKINRRFKGVLAFVAMIVAAIEFGPRKSRQQAQGYERFTEFPSEIAECIHSLVRDGQEKVTLAFKASQSPSPENGLKNPIRLGNTCYVGGQDPTLDTRELPLIAIHGEDTKPDCSEVSAENNPHTKSFYELSQIKNHLA